MIALSIKFDPLEMTDFNEVVVVGSCMMDFTGYAPKLPKAGETIHGTKFEINFGGKGANQCVAASKLGAKTTLVSRVGDDLWGDKYIDNLKSLGIKTDYVLMTKGFSTGIAQINVAESGENQIVIIAGANHQLNQDDITNASYLIENAKVLVLQLETPPETAIEAMKLCKGISILNGAPAQKDFNLELLRLPYIFCVNESEAEIFSGVHVANKTDAEKAAKLLMSMGCQRVLITLGADGAIFSDKQSGNIFYVDSPKVKCVDSTGASDCFIGALAYFLAKRNGDFDLSDMIEKACIIAADSVTRLGTQISFPDAEILKHIGVKDWVF